MDYWGKNAFDTHGEKTKEYHSFVLSRGVIKNLKAGWVLCVIVQA